MDSKLLKIGVFYDGNYFFYVSNYYAFRHDRRARISIGGLHDFIRARVAECEETRISHCQIVDAHYFRGRFPTAIVEQKGWLRGERLFDDVLMYEGITTHYWPMSDGAEKGVDVAFALEAFELAMFKRFDVCVLIAGDGDYVPLVRKLNMLGTRVMVLGWDFDFVDERSGLRRETRVSKVLLKEATYPVLMNAYIDDALRAKDNRIDDLFVPKNAHDTLPDPNEELEPPCLTTLAGTIKRLDKGWGFIKPSDGSDDVYFYCADVLHHAFDELRVGQEVTFSLGANERGPIARTIRLITAAQSTETPEY